MNPYYEDEAVKIFHGDCLAVLRTMPANSVDSIVTDPPYGLSFMGKKWDYDVPSVEIWAECLRVLKPGGHLLAFAGTRTQHRMAVRIEDAGFEIRDMLAWVYGSGFPKSLDVSKAIDEKAGAKREVVGSKLGQPGYSLAPDKGRGTYSPDGRDSAIECAITAPATEAAKKWEGWGTALKPALEPITLARKPPGRYEWTCIPPGAEGCTHHSSTALSVAVCVKCGAVLKFLPSTVAENVLAHGTGGINVDGCRVEGAPRNPGFQDPAESSRDMMHTSNARLVGYESPTGRWPANLIHDGSEEVTGLFPHTKSGVFTRRKTTICGDNGNAFNTVPTDYAVTGSTGGDSGSAARFFYCAKSSKADRNAGLDDFETVPNTEIVGRDADSAGINNPRAGAGRTFGAKNPHPTVKPTELMRYLCRLVTPPGGVVLDPFMGSGSTGRAAILEGFGFVGIEREEQYLHVAQARVLSARKEINAACNTDLQATMDL